MLDCQESEQPDVCKEHISTLANDELQKLFSWKNMKQLLLFDRWTRADSGWVKLVECTDVFAVISLEVDGFVQSTPAHSSYLVKQPHEEYRQTGVQHIV